MSLLPMMFRSLRPSSWVEQQLKLMRQMDAILNTPRPPPLHLAWPELYADLDSSVKSQSGPFKIQLDLKHFKPQEISVKTVNGEIVVEGCQESNTEKEGFVSRHFMRTYYLPDGHKPEHVVSSFSKDGVLTIMAPMDKASDVERVVPIEMEEKEKEKNSS